MDGEGTMVGEIVGSLASGKGGRVEGTSTGIESTGPNSGKGGSPSGLGASSSIGDKGGRGGDWALTEKKTCIHIDKANR